MVQEGAEYSCIYRGKESMRIDVETTIWRGLGVCRVYQEGFNRISGRSERYHDSQIHVYFYVWADHSCHVVETDFDSMPIESKNEHVTP